MAYLQLLHQFTMILQYYSYQAAALVVVNVEVAAELVDTENFLQAHLLLKKEVIIQLQ
jgi:uncharacterized protein YqgQ